MNKLPKFLEDIFFKSSKSYSIAKKGDGKGNVTYKQLELLCKRQQIIIKRLVDSQIKLNNEITKIIFKQFTKENSKNDSDTLRTK